MNTLGNTKVLPLLSPVDTTSTATEAFSTPIDTGEFVEGEIDLYCGTITDDTVVVKLYKDANTTTSGGTAVGFLYKLTAATGSDSDGAWTACASTGVTLAVTDDDKILRINVDPALFSGYPYAYIGMDPGASISAFEHAVWANLVLRYSQSVPPSVID